MKKNAGFTLVEIMVAVVVIGIVSGVALTSYQSNVKASRRSTAQADLMELARFMEGIHTPALTYTPGGSNPTLPFANSPRTGTAYYTIAIQAATAQTFTLRATPTGNQVGNGMLEIDSTGAKRWDKNNDSSFSADENVWK
ncbi:type IV pilin protein [Undibacterium sp. TJN19]|uniref:type IV pilin protein n=1 Tax=Undibacterium sp. TJN19 TaxID=3413055 RepID=UPI003BEFA023